MRKVFFYLLFMVLILPSIGLTSLRAVFEFLVHSTTDHNLVKWSCIFLPDNGAFFVNYVITSALVGTALELMRFSELFMYAIRMMFARSIAETPSIRKANLYEYPYGFNYGWMLLVKIELLLQRYNTLWIMPFSDFCTHFSIRSRLSSYYSFRPFLLVYETLCRPIQHLLRLQTFQN